MFDKLLEKTKKVFEVDKDKSDEELIEKLAALEHEQWM